MTVRARALVGFEAERLVGQHAGWLRRLFSSGTREAMQRAVMAATVLVVASVGFMVGGGLGDSFASERYGSSHTTSSYSSTPSELDLFSDGI